MFKDSGRCDRTVQRGYCYLHRGSPHLRTHFLRQGEVLGMELLWPGWGWLKHGTKNMQYSFGQFCLFHNPRGCHRVWRVKPGSAKKGIGLVKSKHLTAKTLLRSVVRTMLRTMLRNCYVIPICA